MRWSHQEGDVGPISQPLRRIIYRPAAASGAENAAVDTYRIVQFEESYQVIFLFG